MNKTIGIVIVILLLIISILLGGYLYLTINDKKDKESSLQTTTTDIHTPSINMLEQGEGDEKLTQIGPLYPLDQFILNLKNKDDIYVKIKIDLELSIPELKNELDAKKAVIKDIVIRILTSKSMDDFSTDEGKEVAMDEIINSLNAKLEDGYIKNAYITDLVIQ